MHGSWVIACVSMATHGRLANCSTSASRAAWEAGAAVGAAAAAAFDAAGVTFLAGPQTDLGSLPSCS